jgi:hypothetical protein
MSREQYDRLPEELELRELRYWIVRPGYRTRMVTLVTTLLDPALYPKDSLAELYGLRWRVETHLRNLKMTLKMRRLKCQKTQGVRKELIAYALVYNLVHAVMARAAAAQQTTPDRISFIDVLRWLWTAQSDKLMPLFVVNPAREGRSEPRAVKDYHSKFPGLPKPRKIIKEQMQKKRRVK